MTITKEQLINKRIKFDNIEDYTKVVELALSIGFRWRHGSSSDNTNFHKYLFIGGDGMLIHTDADSNWRDDACTNFDKIHDISVLFIETKQIIDEDNFIVILQGDILTIAKENSIIDINKETFISLSKTNLVFKDNDNDEVQLNEEEIKMIMDKLK